MKLGRKAMNKVLFVYDYQSNNKESQLLISSKNLEKIGIQNKQSIIKIKEKHRISMTIYSVICKTIVLDSPYSLVNMGIAILVAIKRTMGIKSKIYLSVRGNLPCKGVNNYNTKKVYWKILALLMNYSGGIIIASSIFEKKKLLKSRLFSDSNIRVIPDIIYSINTLRISNDYSVGQQ